MGVGRQDGQGRADVCRRLIKQGGLKVSVAVAGYERWLKETPTGPDGRGRQDEHGERQREG